MAKIKLVKNGEKTIAEVTENIVAIVKEKKENDRFSLKMSYGNDKGTTLLSLSQLKGSVADASVEGIYVQLLPIECNSKKVILKVISKSEFEKIYKVVDFKKSEETKTVKPSKFELLYNSLNNYIEKCTDEGIKADLMEIIGSVEADK